MTKRELYAVIYFVQLYRHYLIAAHFVIRTDHASLKWLKGYKEADDLMTRWNYKLDTYDFARNNFIKKFMYKLDGNSSKRILDNLITILEKQNKKT